MTYQAHQLTQNQRHLFATIQQARNNKNYPLALDCVKHIFTELTWYKPAMLEAAMVLVETNNIDVAENVLNQLLSSNFEPYLTLHLLAVINKNKRQFAKAIEFYLKALQIKPQSTIDLLGIAYSYAQIGDLARAISHSSVKVEAESDNLLLQDYLGQLYLQKGDLASAESVFKSLLGKSEQQEKVFYSLASINKAKGNLIAATDLYQKAIACNEQFIAAHFALSSLTNYKKDSFDHLNKLKRLFSIKNLSIQDQTLLCFALAKAYEQNEEYDESFKYLSQGNGNRFNVLQYDVNADLQLMSNIAQRFTKAALARFKDVANNSAKPIFIIGMPRSGTTLIEKILGSHSSVSAAGELEHMFKQGCSFLNEQFVFNELTTYSVVAFKASADAYLSALAATSDSEHITDKLPLNFLMVGFIKALFPNAKIIHCKRNKQDTCLSIYKKNFSNDNYRFAYNLKALNSYYDGYLQLMKHWHTQFPGEIIDVDYEQLATNPEVEIPNLIAKCDLDWQTSCLSFYKTEGVVHTASAVQVRQPMYTNTISLWQKYEKHLSELV